MEFQKVLDGVVKYVSKEIIVNMNPLQDFAARLAIARIIGNSEAIKTMLSSNPFVRAFAISDENGNIDVDGLVRDLKKVISGKGFVEFEIPMFGKFKFVESDVDTLRSYIGGV